MQLHWTYRSMQGELNLAYETYHTRILLFERYVRTLTYSILAYAYPRALEVTVIKKAQMCCVMLSGFLLRVLKQTLRLTAGFHARFTVMSG